MRLFIQTFEGGVRIWFKGHPTNTLDSWDALEMISLGSGERRRTIFII